MAERWAEACDTLTYQQLARSELPALLIGPLSKDAIDSLGTLPWSGHRHPPTVLYTENRSHDQDQTLITQYRLRALLHKPFSNDVRQRLLGGGAVIGSAHAPVATPLPPFGGRAESCAAPSPRRATTAAHAHEDPAHGQQWQQRFRRLSPGSTCASSVRSEMPAKRSSSEVDLPTGVQKLLQDPTGAGAAPAPSGALAPEAPSRRAAPAGQGSAPSANDGESRKRLSEPRSITVLIIEDRFGTAPLIVERTGAPGQRCHIAPSYQEALPILERFMSSSMGCELVVGPLSADGVAAVREYRKRGWGNHVVSLHRVWQLNPKMRAYPCNMVA